jgi:hypothetical protein
VIQDIKAVHEGCTAQFAGKQRVKIYTKTRKKVTKMKVTVL